MARRKRRYVRYRTGRKCRFCRGELVGVGVDYKDIRTLSKLTTVQGKLFGRKRSGAQGLQLRAELQTIGA